MQWAAKFTSVKRRLLMTIFLEIVEKDRCNIQTQQGEPDKSIFRGKGIKIDIGWGTCNRCERWKIVILRREYFPILYDYYTTTARFKFRLYTDFPSKYCQIIFITFELFDDATFLERFFSNFFSNFAVFFSNDL